MDDYIDLGDIVRIQRGITYKSSLLNEPGPVLLGLGTIERHGGFKGTNLRTYGGDSPDSILVQPGQLYASLKDVTQTADVLGAVARIPDGTIGRLTQDTVRLDLIDDQIDLDYLYWVLRTPQYRDYCRSHATGTTTMGLPREDFFAFEVPRPTKERLALSVLLGALDDKIAANDKLVRLSEEMAGAIVLANFNGQSDSLRTIALVTMGSSPPGTSYNEASKGLPFYQGVRDFGVRFPTRRIWTNAPVRMAETNDTLCSVRAPVGETNLANEAMCIGRGIASLRSLTDRPMTLFHQVRAAKSEWAPYQAEGTVFGSINKTQLEAIAVPAVPEDVAEGLEQEIGAFEARISAALKENQELAKTRDSLLPLLMSGKVRVRDAEKVVEEVV